MAGRRRPVPVDLQALRHKQVVVLPDLFVDCLVPLPAWQDTSRLLAQVAGHGGGNLPVAPIEVRVGGNAANLALGLARLGVPTTLIASTDALGMHLLREAARDVPLALDHVRVGDKASSTVALECTDANIMLSHAGAVAEFGPEHLQSADEELLCAADAVACVNWSQNMHGTALLARLIDLMPSSTFLYMDTGDPRHRADAPSLLEAVARWHRVDAWGMNENEAHAFGGPGSAVDTAARLATRCGTRIDLHTRTLAASLTATERVLVEADRTPARRLTGAGDAWNAGNLAGYLLDLPARQRLGLAHQVATDHVTLAV